MNLYFYPQLSGGIKTLPLYIMLIVSITPIIKNWPKAKQLDYHYFECLVQVAEAPLTDEEIDLLLTQLTSEEIEKLLEDTDPDDKHMPPSAR